MLLLKFSSENPGLRFIEFVDRIVIFMLLFSREQELQTLWRDSVQPREVLQTTQRLWMGAEFDRSAVEHRHQVQL